MGPLKKIFSEYGIGAIIFLAVVVYLGFGFFKNISNKGMAGSETMQSAGSGASVYKGNGGVQPAEALGQNETFASADGAKTSMSGMPTACSKPNIQNPADLLPHDQNSQWAALNPTGGGMLGSVNLLKAGELLGVDTISSSMRNASLDIRSTPPNPVIKNISPWNQSTITHDYMRPSFEIGQGAQ